YRDVLLYKASQKTSGMIYSDALHQIRTQAAKLDYETLEWILKSIEKTKRQLQSNVSGEVALDSLLLSIKENY
ncbi:MAG: DNA polymerase III subunit delta, partial [Lachnospiraceae bacterium]|nr:DNA polymerase III subunit delta [Lachnospiraceae bacterium]